MYNLSTGISGFIFNICELEESAQTSTEEHNFQQWRISMQRPHDSREPRVWEACDCPPLAFASLEPGKVFGTAVSTSIQYAGTEVCYGDEGVMVWNTNWYTLPLIVAKIGNYLGDKDGCKIYSCVFPVA